MYIHYDCRNDLICCDNAFAVKDIIKGYGFRFCSVNKSWVISRPKDLSVLGNLICDVVVDCKLDYYAMCDLIAQLPAECAETMMFMDESHTAKAQAAFAD